MAARESAEPERAGDEALGWLAADSRAAWLAIVKMLLVLPGALEAQLLRDSDLTLLGYMILARLAAAPGQSLQMSHLATMAGGSLPRTSQAVARMERRGWVRRSVISRGRGQGRRFTVATLTAAGRTQLRQATPAHAGTVQRFVLDPAGDQLGELGAVAARIAGALGLPPQYPPL